MEITNTEATGNQRVAQLFRFLRSYDQLRNPAKRVLDYPWQFWLQDLPEHPAVRVTYEAFNIALGDKLLTGDSMAEGTFLYAGRPTLESAPLPPAEIREWVEPTWKDINGSIKRIESKTVNDLDDEEKEVRFDADVKRAAALFRWKKEWEQWQEEETPAYAAMDLFNRLYEVYGQMQRESERVELVLGTGILNWRRPEGDIRHPVVLNRLLLEFHPETPAFTLTVTDNPAEFYSGLFRASDEVDGRLVAQLRQEMETLEIEPLDDKALTGFLSSFATRLSSQGQFVEEDPKGFQTHPCISLSPVIFLRNRATGFADALDSILRDLRTRTNTPSSLLQTAGVPTTPIETNDAALSSQRFSAWGTEDILLSKPANAEQIQIAERLAAHDCVLVQGPPGTGKTHTIANLIGHLLAQGKTILVTSYTAKALRVLREQVVAPLQPLCVSVLGGDSAGNSQLESSVAGISERLASDNADRLKRNGAAHDERRREILSQLRKRDEDILDARGNEYRALVIGGQEYLPSDAARRVAEGRDADDWIPTPITLGAVLPLSPTELAELYATNIEFTQDEEDELKTPLPDINALPTPEEWTNFVHDRTRFQEEVGKVWVDFWSREGNIADIDALQQALNVLEKGAESLTAMEAWELELLSIGQNPERRNLWDELVNRVAQVYEEGISAERADLEHDPALHPSLPLEEQVKVLESIQVHLQGGKSLNWLASLTNPAWKSVLQSVTVRGKRPTTADEFDALLTIAKITLRRAELTRRWERQITSMGGPSVSGSEPERFFQRYVASIENSLNWRSVVWKPLQEILTERGFKWNEYLQSRRVHKHDTENAGDLQNHIVPDLLSKLRIRVAALRLVQLTAQK